VVAFKVWLKAAGVEQREVEAAEVMLSAVDKGVRHCFIKTEHWKQKSFFE
jgi:hypothetical protein